MYDFIKICGLSTVETVQAAIAASADYVGFVFYPKSPRNVSVATAATLQGKTCGRAGAVALTVDADDDLIALIARDVKPDYIQLHGKETPERAAEIFRKHKLRTIKVLSIASADDLAAIKAFDGACHMFLFDAKPPKDGKALPGGNGIPFDWRLVKDLKLPVPAMLSGGLTVDNVGEAIRLTGFHGLDLSSGVERAPGVKDVGKIHAFCSAARVAWAA